MLTLDHSSSHRVFYRIHSLFSEAFALMPSLTVRENVLVGLHKYPLGAILWNGM